MDIVTMPRLGVTMTSGKVSIWRKEEGDKVNIGEVLFEMESDKSNVEIECQYAGILKAILVKEGMEVPVGMPIAVIAGEDEEVDLSQFKPAPAEESEQSVAAQKEVDPVKVAAELKSNDKKVSPRIRKLASELGVCLDNIQGSGPGGIIREEDVKRAAAGSVKIKEKVKLNSIRKVMAKNMLESWTTIPQYTQIVTVNANKLLQVKKEVSNVSINDIVIKVIAEVIKEYPIVNSRLDNEEVTVFEDINVSVAMLTDNGLIVPVVKNVDSKTVSQISQEVKELSLKASGNELTLDDFNGGTITISNLGPFGVECGTPIINPPQSTLVFVGTIKKTPVFNENDEVVAASLMQLSIGYDHRFIDGATAAGFTSRVKKAIENVTIDDLG